MRMVHLEKRPAATGGALREPGRAAPFRTGGALVAFGLLIWAASLPLTHWIDEAVTLWLQRAAPAPDLPASLLVFLGNAEVVIPAAALVAALRIRRNRRVGLAGLWLVSALALGSVLAVTLKYLIVHPGVPAMFQRPVHRLGLQGGTPYSFPSGHTLRTTLLAGTVLRDLPWLAIVLVLSMMTALVYLGGHWLSDVLGGLCLGWAMCESWILLRKARSRSYRRD